MEKIKLGEIQVNPRYTEKQNKELRKRLDKLNDELKVRQESINLLKGRLKSQITSFKETIAKVLDKDTSLGEKIRNLFREQGITIASILTAIGMAIGVLVEALLPGGGVLPQHQVEVNHLLKMRKVSKNGLGTNLTLRAPRVLVPTPSTKGGSKRTPPVSQEREMLQT